MFLCPNSRQKYKLRSPTTWTLPSECIPRELSFESSQASTKFVWQFRILKFLGLDNEVCLWEWKDWLVVESEYSLSKEHSFHQCSRFHVHSQNHWQSCILVVLLNNVEKVLVTDTSFCVWRLGKQSFSRDLGFLVDRIKAKELDCQCLTDTETHIIHMTDLRTTKSK